MKRIDHLNRHLTNLTAINKDGVYDESIQNIVVEMNHELGIDEDPRLSSYSTDELYDELIKRSGVYSAVVNSSEEALITIVTGEQDQVKSFSGPVKILVNQD